jgi:hypothetical protein
VRWGVVFLSLEGRGQVRVKRILIKHPLTPYQVRGRLLILSHVGERRRGMDCSTKLANLLNRKYFMKKLLRVKLEGALTNTICCGKI